ncbi:cytochrome b/b6 domain-containing protein [Lutimaribacter sp. EGI FJ00015]|uniref:Cytochrome b/b6 domain-containing protein n=1 Tax=Lutimaribacter degradans TaxID=2945989 RepID=A0ACC5ZV92_9RHOB|nr:cytochrome b/b6 domain-containing protein [Lutimaribacter sp. EGI FJ00013]MCM2562264.1 cytochrome b/b6 domain-containing protein [Lutimaribacter sp. EGI FJ00013]MCO0613419.1 cytochrome b/b6 domain-containing protein [Lutimaribacter sp. EGI FJ00015]MCO0636393.1 cytochrome b/b6 domain-containing protein [Lutimaribacter sp. EGI FJ00014]
MAEADDTALVRVWDPLIRIGHWTLVAAFAIAWLSEDSASGLHSYAGYAIAAVVALRVAWGLVGPRHARFSDFITGPRRVLAYMRDLLSGQAERHIGHSPAGGAMTVALLAALALTALSGMATLAVEDGKGPLAGLVAAENLPNWTLEQDDHEAGHGNGEALEEVHEAAANATLVLIVLHIAGVLAASLAHRENLVRAMFTGRKSAR